jgi:hypothetical protein
LLAPCLQFTAGPGAFTVQLDNHVIDASRTILATSRTMGAGESPPVRSWHLGQVDQQDAFFFRCRDNSSVVGFDGEFGDELAADSDSVLMPE